MPAGDKGPSDPDHPDVFSIMGVSRDVFCAHVVNLLNQNIPAIRLHAPENNDPVSILGTMTREQALAGLNGKTATMADMLGVKITPDMIARYASSARHRITGLSHLSSADEVGLFMLEDALREICAPAKMSTRQKNAINRFYRKYGNPNDPNDKGPDKEGPPTVKFPSRE